MTQYMIVLILWWLPSLLLLVLCFTSFDKYGPPLEGMGDAWSKDRAEQG